MKSNRRAATTISDLSERAYIFPMHITVHLHQSDSNCDCNPNKFIVPCIPKVSLADISLSVMSFMRCLSSNCIEPEALDHSGLDPDCPRMLILWVISVVSVSPEFCTRGKIFFRELLDASQSGTSAPEGNIFRDAFDASQSRTSVLPECLKSRSGLKL